MFVAYQKIQLSGLGEEWEDAYVKVVSPSMEQVKQHDKKKGATMDKTIDFIEELFVEGKGYNGKELVEIKKSEIKDLPMSALLTVMRGITEGISPKA